MKVIITDNNEQGLICYEKMIQVAPGGSGMVKTMEA